MDKKVAISLADIWEFMGELMESYPNIEHKPKMYDIRLIKAIRIIKESGGRMITRYLERDEAFKDGFNENYPNDSLIYDIDMLSVYKGSLRNIFPEYIRVGQLKEKNELYELEYDGTYYTNYAELTGEGAALCIEMFGEIGNNSALDKNLIVAKIVFNEKVSVQKLDEMIEEVDKLFVERNLNVTKVSKFVRLYKAPRGFDDYKIFREALLRMKDIPYIILALVEGYVWWGEDKPEDVIAFIKRGAGD